MALSTIDVKPLDDFTAFMASMPGRNARARSSALGSVGFAMKGWSRDAVKNNELGWPGMSKLAAVTRKYPARKYGDRTPSRQIVQHQYVGNMQARMWGSLVGLLVYTLDKENGEILFGFQAGTFGMKTGYTRSTGERVRVANVIGESAVELCRKLTEGFEYTVGTTAQQRYFAALGFVMPIGSKMKIPERPLVGPVAIAHQNDIHVVFSDKFWASMRRQVLGGNVEGVMTSAFGRLAA